MVQVLNTSNLIKEADHVLLSVVVVLENCEVTMKGFLAYRTCSVANASVMSFCVLGSRDASRRKLC